MCGACGSGRVRAPWEDAVEAPGPAVRRRRAAALSRLLVPGRRRVEAWATGFVVHGPVGPPVHAGDVDGVVARAGRHRLLTTTALPGDLAGDDAAEAVVRASAAAWLRGSARLHGPGVGHAVRVLAHGSRPVDLVPHPDRWWLGDGGTGA
jgi:hypothetical protein